jgi:OmpA-OmpF porin, OOP family
MAETLLETLRGGITPTFVTQVAAVLGEAESNVSQGVQAVLPTLLGGLAAQTSTPADAATFVPLVNNRENATGLVLNANATSPAHALGQQFLKGVLGQRQPAIIGALAITNGLKAESVATLLGLLSPYVLGTLGKHFEGSATTTTLSAFLQRERDSIASAVPSSVRSMLDSTQPVLAEVSPVASPSVPPAAPKLLPKPLGFDEWIAIPIAFAVIGGILFFGMRGCSKPEVGTVVADAQQEISQVVPLVVSTASPTPSPVAVETETTPAPIASLAAIIASPSAIIASPAAIAVSPNASPVPPASPATTPTPAPKSTPAPETKPTPAPVASAPIAGGLEDNLTNYIKDKNQPIERSIWFDFDRLYFDTGKSTLRPASKSQLQAIAQILKTYPNVKIKIGGYTDSVGNAGANRRLSARRARAARAAIIAYGIKSSRVRAEGYGETNYLANNETEEGRQKNRRTAIHVTAK